MPRRLLPLLLFMLPASVQAQFNYATNDGVVTITGYTGPGDDVTIPSTIAGLPVVRIGNHAFEFTSLTAITVAAFNPVYSSSVEGVLFDKGQMTLIQ